MPSVSAVNSSSSALSGGATFSGSWEDVIYFDSLVVALLTDQSGTLYVDFSPDAVNVDSTRSYDVAANANEVHRLTITRRYARVRFVNDAVAQSFMRLQTIYGAETPLTSPLNSTIQLDADALVVRTLDTEALLAAGFISGITVVNKFGRNTDIDTGTVPEDVWGGSGAYTGFPDGDPETIEVLSDSVNDTAAGTGARTVRLTGLDADWAIASADLTLNGTTPVATSGTFRRVHTAQVLTAGSGGVNAGTITFRHSTTEANVFLQLMPGRNQTNCSAYTIPAGKTGFLRTLFVNMLGTTSAYCEGFIWTRSFGGVYRQRRPFAVSNANNWRDDIYAGIAFTEKADIVIRILTASANNVSLAAGYDMILVDNA